MNTNDVSSGEKYWIPICSEGLILTKGHLFRLFYGNKDQNLGNCETLNNRKEERRPRHVRS